MHEMHHLKHAEYNRQLFTNMKWTKGFVNIKISVFFQNVFNDENYINFRRKTDESDLST